MMIAYVYRKHSHGDRIKMYTYHVGEKFHADGDVRTYSRQYRDLFR
jgi:hypothetical protein